MTTLSESSKRASQPFVYITEVAVNVGSFNFGIGQNQLSSKKFPTQTLPNLRRVVAKSFEEGDLHLLSGCEVGGHKQGLPACHSDSNCIIDGALQKGEYASSATQAYMSIWHETGASQPGGVSLKPVHAPELFELKASLALEPQLVLTKYTVTANSCEGEGILLVGQLHIRTPHGMKTPSNETKKRAVREALSIIAAAADSCVSQPTVAAAAADSRVSQPTVALLLGDPNLNEANADACCQAQAGEPDLRHQWHTETSSGALSGDVAFVRGCNSTAFDISIGRNYADRGIRNDSHDFFGVTVSVPLFKTPGAPVQKKVRFDETAEAMQPESQCPEKTSSGIKPAEAMQLESQPGIKPAEAMQPESQPGHRPKPRNALFHNVADAILKDMKAWYVERGDDDNVTETWKQLHSVLFKKVRVPYASDLWCQAREPQTGDDVAEGQPMVVSQEFVALQVKSVIERREQWLRKNSLPLQTIMNEQQKEAFLKEVKAEYHGSADQKRRQEADKAAGKKLHAGMKQRWSRECQRRGGTTQMFHLLSFSGRWDPTFFETSPVPTQVGEQAQDKKRLTLLAIEARAKLRLAKKYDRLAKSKRLNPDQESLLRSLYDGSLEGEVNRLTLLSGNGRFRRSDGTFVDIGGSTGGFTRAVLYNWTPPNLDNEFQ